MNATLIRALVALLPTGLLFLGSVVVFLRGRSVRSLLQLLGSGCLVLVVLTHVCEGLQVLRWMHWGLQDSAGHYLDMSSAVLGLTLFPIGYVLSAFAKRLNGS